MPLLLSLSRAIDRLTTWIGKAAAWLVLAAVVLSAGNAVVRKAFDWSSNAFLELQWYLFGAVFMLAAAYTLRRNEHVRIDVLSARWSRRTRDWVDLFGHIFFLVPFVGLMTWLSWPFFLSSWRSGEISGATGGLPLWPAKGLVFLGFALLGLQAVSEIIKKAAALAGIPGADDPRPDGDAPPGVPPPATIAPGHAPDRATRP
jgi:TRAP-type mannitol/chloroaromatic compound transport system permease small subunit